MSEREKPTHMNNNGENKFLATFKFHKKTGTSSEKLPENNGHFRAERLWKVAAEYASCVTIEDTERMSRISMIFKTFSIISKNF